jgi:hypothetical protein
MSIWPSPLKSPTPAAVQPVPGLPKFAPPLMTEFGVVQLATVPLLF